MKEAARTAGRDLKEGVRHIVEETRRGEIAPQLRRSAAAAKETATETASELGA